MFFLQLDPTSLFTMTDPVFVFKVLCDSSYFTTHSKRLTVYPHQFRVIFREDSVKPK